MNFLSKVGIVTLSILIVVAFASASQYFSNAKLHSNCLKVEPTPSLTTEWGLQLFAGARFYIPFGSSKAVQHISELISEQNPGSEKSEDSQKMCGLVRIKGFKLQIEGHEDHLFLQDCAVIKKGENHCVVNSRSANPEMQKAGDGIFTIVWTDNSSSMAVVRCTSDGVRNDWYVFSFQPSMNETVKETVISAMNNLGFNDTMADTVSPSYEGCELFNPDEEN